MPLAFATPLILTALLLLPAIWWLLRLTPPKPRIVQFPPTRLLLDIIKPDETPAHSPWWLTAIRLALAAAIILALAGPLWQPDENRAPLAGNSLIIVDNGFASAPDWTARMAAVNRLIDAAAENDFLIALVPAIAAAGDYTGAVTAPPPQLRSPAEARSLAQALEPQALPLDRARLASHISAFLASRAGADIAQIVWISDKLATPQQTGVAAPGDQSFLSALNDSNLPVILLQQSKPLLALNPPVNGVDDMTVSANRLDITGQDSRLVQAFDLQNRLIATSELTFEEDSARAETTLDLPTELRNDIARIEVTGSGTAAGVQLLDDRFRRKVVGILSGEGAEAAQPLLSPAYYVRRALGPYADLRIEAGANIATSIEAFINEGVSVIVMTDVGTLLGDAGQQLENFINAGGLVIRFAGPRLASAEDGLVPVALRSGGRILGGSLSWETPQQLAGFSEQSPFADIPLNEQIQAETTVRQQVLAEPDAGLSDRTWAYLEDGTPLVTARQMGNGWLVLFHVTADTNWSDLPLSGLFVDMLRATLPLARVQETASSIELSNATQNAQFMPFQTLSAAGLLITPENSVKAIAASGAVMATPDNPPGFYGVPERYRALNVFEGDVTLTEFDATDLATVARMDFAPATTIDLKPAIFTLALVLLLADALAVLLMQGVFVRLFRGKPGMRSAASGLLVAVTVAGLLYAEHGYAQNAAPADETAALQRAMEDANETRLAYIITGNAEIDDISRQGLSGLSQFLASRTSLEPAYPRGLNPETDELAFYPLIYWPIDPESELPSEETMARIDAFMKQGGSVLFDTRDQLSAAGSTGFGATPASLKLRNMLASLDVPPLEPVPMGHVLTKSFFLLSVFPGRYLGSPLWVEARNQDGSTESRGTDGVSSILITANDFASAWAVSVDGRPLLPTVPNDPRQRELAFRTGANIAMYTLTGNYKADQVHLPALLERLGQ
tara:strand:+ start:6607 stop:9492 length:2886 start_codon:yes stop_codon:yes gene_type:complete